MQRCSPQPWPATAVQPVSFRTREGSPCRQNKSPSHQEAECCHAASSSDVVSDNGPVLHMAVQRLVKRHAGAPVSGSTAARRSITCSSCRLLRLMCSLLLLSAKRPNRGSLCSCPRGSHRGSHSQLPDLCSEVSQIEANR